MLFVNGSDTVVEVLPVVPVAQLVTTTGAKVDLLASGADTGAAGPADWFACVVS